MTKWNNLPESSRCTCLFCGKKSFRFQWCKWFCSVSSLTGFIWIHHWCTSKTIHNMKYGNLVETNFIYVITNLPIFLAYCRFLFLFKLYFLSTALKNLSYNLFRKFCTVSSSFLSFFLALSISLSFSLQFYVLPRLSHKIRGKIK